MADYRNKDNTSWNAEDIRRRPSRGTEGGQRAARTVQNPWTGESMPSSMPYQQPPQGSAPQTGPRSAGSQTGARNGPASAASNWSGTPSHSDIRSRLVTAPPQASVPPAVRQGAPGRPDVSAAAPTGAGRPGVSAAAPTGAGRQGVSAAAPTGAGRQGVSAAAPTGAGRQGVSAAAPTGAGRQGVSAAAPTGAGRQGVSAAAPTGAGRPGASTAYPTGAGRPGASTAYPTGAGRPGASTAAPTGAGRSDASTAGTGKLGIPDAFQETADAAQPGQYTARNQSESERRARERAARNRRRAMTRRRRGIPWWIRLPLYLVFVAVVSMVVGEYGWRLAQDLCALDETNPEPTVITVTVANEDDLETVSQKLYDAGLIQYKWFFQLFGRVAHAERKIGAGVYELNTDMDYSALIRGMHSSSGSMNADVVRLTIPEGYTADDIFTLLAKNGVASKEELLAAARNTEFGYDFIDNTSHEVSRLEGYLFPDTYDFFQPENPVSVLNKFLDNFRRKRENWTEALASAQNRGYNLDKIIIIASLIEKETDGTDQARIASVIYNRLDGSGDRGGTYGLLQIDAALLYALPDHTGAITTTDLETNSPYNLYKNAGLPPTAIANPGEASIRAALSPESTSYFYYGLAKDGRHRFFSNYREFTAFLDSKDYIGN